MKKNYKLPKGKALMLRTCSAKLTSFCGFQWKESGEVVAPDFNTNKVCKNGLFGLLWGQGSEALLDWSLGAKWLVCEIDADSLIDLGSKIKVERAKVVYCGGRQGALDFLRPHLPAPMHLPGDAIISGHGCTSISGDKSTSISGEDGTSISDYRGTSISGHRGTSTSGYLGTSISGDDGTSTSGHSGTSISGDGGTSISGDWGTSQSGCGGIAQSGDAGTLMIHGYDYENNQRIAIAYVGENGIKPNTPYRLDTALNFVEVQS